MGRMRVRYLPKREFIDLHFRAGFRRVSPMQGYYEGDLVISTDIVTDRDLVERIKEWDSGTH